MDSPGRGGPGGWEMGWSRRQFLLRGGAAVGAVSLWRLADARVAAGDVPEQLSGEELAVLADLVSAIMIAVGKTGNPADLGLQAPGLIAVGFSQSGSAARAFIVSVVDAIDHGPSSGTFVSLSDAQRQAFLREALAPLVPPPATAVQLHNLAAASQAVAVASARLAASLGVEQPGLHAPSPNVAPPPAGAHRRSAATPRTQASELLAEAVVAGLSLVATPFVVPPPPPPLPSLPVGLVLSLVEQLVAGVPVDGLPQSLLDQLREAVDVPAPDEPAPELPAKVMGDAIAVWTR